MKPDVKVLNKLIPKNINKIILKELSNSHWFIDSKNPVSRLERISSKINSGFSITTVSDGNPTINSVLNIYGNIIYESILERLKLKATLSRFNWNMYLTNAETSLHTDNTKEYISVLYSLHDSDGGIMVDGYFFKDKEGEAKVFNSCIEHKGFGPKKDSIRFNLNIVFKPE